MWGEESECEERCLSVREGLTEGRATNLKEESYEAGFNLSGALAERVLNVYRAFESLPYGFSSKFRSKDAN